MDPFGEVAAVCRFRHAFSGFPSGVVAVATQVDDAPMGCL